MDNKEFTPDFLLSLILSEEFFRKPFSYQVDIKSIELFHERQSSAN